MRDSLFCVAVALGMVLGGAVRASAEIYRWTDEAGVVQMTNRWANVPESARARVSVRDSTPLAREGTPAPEPAPRPVEPPAVTQPTVPTSPEMAQTPPTVAPSPFVLLYPGGSSVLIPSSRPFVRHPHKVFPPFPYNVHLDPVDPNVVRAGRSRVPKDTFTFPRVSLDTQIRFRNRVRTLEQHRSVPHAPFPALPVRP
jgi:hypothetical protein